MIRIGSNNDADADADAVKKDRSYIMIEPIVHHSHHRRENHHHHINNRRRDDDSPLELYSDNMETDEQKSKRRRKMTNEIVERLESKMDQKIGDQTKKIDQLSIDVSKLKESVDELKHFNNFILNYVINRDRDRRDRSKSRSRSVSRSRSRDREQTESSNFIDTETLADLREQHSRPTSFAANLMQKLFTMDELTVKNVNVEGRNRKSSKMRANALSPTRVAELKRLTLLNVRKEERKSVWISCRNACNQKLYVLKKMREEEEENRDDAMPSPSPSDKSEQPAAAATVSNFVDNRTIAILRNQRLTPRELARNLMLKLFTMDEMTVDNLNVEGRAPSGSQVPAVGLSPTRVAELKRHCLENVAKNKRETVWRECREACNKKLRLLNKKKKMENVQQVKQELDEE